MVMDKLRKILRKNPDCLEDEVTLEHCRGCKGDCPFINGCC